MEDDICEESAPPADEGKRLAQTDQGTLKTREEYLLMEFERIRSAVRERCHAFNRLLAAAYVLALITLLHFPNKALEVSAMGSRLDIRPDLVSAGGFVLGALLTFLMVVFIAYAIGQFQDMGSIGWILSRINSSALQWDTHNEATLLPGVAGLVIILSVKTTLALWRDTPFSNTLAMTQMTLTALLVFQPWLTCLILCILTGTIDTVDLIFMGSYQMLLIILGLMYIYNAYSLRSARQRRREYEQRPN